MDVHAPAGIFGSRPGEQDAPSFRSVVASFTAQVDGAGGEDAASTPASTPVSTPASPDPAPRSPASPNPYADQPFEWGLDALVARTLTLLG